MSTASQTTARTPQPDDPPVSALFQRLYAFFYNKYVGIAIILAMAVATLLGTLLQQVPDSVRTDPEAYAAWLDQVRPRYGGWTPVLSALGLFHVFSSWWFQAIAVLLALSIIACTVHRLPQLIERAFHPHVHASKALFEHARYRSALPVPLTPDAAQAALREHLRKRNFRVLTDPADAGSIYADRFRWAPFGTAVAHTGFVVILLGVLLSSVTGFSEPSFPVTVGQRVAVGHGTALEVEATSFTDSYYADGRPKDYASDLVLYENGRQVAQQTIRVNQPLRHGGVSFYQSYYGTSAVVEIKDASGKVLFSGGVPQENSTQDQQNVFGRLTVPGRDLTVYTVTAASGRVQSTLRPGEMEFNVYDAAKKPVGVKVGAQGQPTTIGDLTYTFVREAPFTGLQVANDPGAFWVWLGSVLTAIGTIITMFLKHRRVWGRVVAEPDGTSRILLASPERNDSVFERWFRRLVTDLDRAGRSVRAASTGKGRHDG